tara:strand:- start:495 stop:1175 length:681 start_codon:yes stop_codon:yes gene_type:complete
MFINSYPCLYGGLFSLFVALVLLIITIIESDKIKISNFHKIFLGISDTPFLWGNVVVSFFATIFYVIQFAWNNEYLSKILVFIIGYLLFFVLISTCYVILYMLGGMSDNFNNGQFYTGDNNQTELDLSSWELRTIIAVHILIMIGCGLLTFALYISNSISVQLEAIKNERSKYSPTIKKRLASGESLESIAKSMNDAESAAYKRKPLDSRVKTTVSDIKNLQSKKK